MVRYAVDGDKRNRTYGYLFVLLLFADFILWTSIDHFVADDSLPVRFIMFAISVLPTSFILLIDHIPAEWLLKVSKVPYIGGRYDVVIRSSFDDFGKEYRCTIDIRQTFFDIEINLEAEKSGSYATSVFLGEVGGKPHVLYAYSNIGSRDDYSLLRHEGTCELIIDSGGVSGKYYTNPERNTYGTVNSVFGQE